MRFVSYAELKKRYGIKWTRKHILELIRQGLFPATVDVGGNTRAFIDTELDDWQAARVAARDNPSPETVAAHKSPQPKPSPDGAGVASSQGRGRPA